MSLRIWGLICGGMLILPISFAVAAPSAQFGAMVGRISPDAGTPAVFGNREEGFSIKIDGVAAQSASLHADVFQVADKLAMPLSKDIHLQEGVTFPNASSQYLRTSMKFPDVKARAEVLVRLALVQNGTAIPLGDMRFEVFPASMTKDLTNLLQPKGDSAASVVVFGPGQNLRHFLTGLHVPFEDGGSGTPDRFDPSRLYFGELASDEQFQDAQDHGAGARLVLFSHDESLPAGVYADRSSSGVLIHVTSPLLDNLNDDPRAQLGLMKIIHLLSAPLPSAN